MSNTLVDVCILTAGRFDLLEQCLDALPDAFEDVSYSVYLLDNGSDKKMSLAFFKNYPLADNIEKVRWNENIGFPAGNNLLVRRGKSPLVLLLNDDVILHKGAGKALVQEMDTPEVGVCGAKLIFPVDSYEKGRPAGKIQHVGLYTDIVGNFRHLFIGWDKENSRVKRVREVLAVTGACLMTRRKLWKKVKGLGTEFGKGTMEDVDYCLKVLNLGNQEVVVCQNAIGEHYVGQTAIFRKEPFPIQKNFQILLNKWGGRYPWNEWIYA